MADINVVTQQFTDYYYNTFDANRASLEGLYRPESMLSFEGTQHLGAKAITEKLLSLPFQKVEHQVETRDAQPQSLGGVNGILVLVTGLLVVDGGPNKLRFSQAFTLIPDGASFYVYNDVFRLVYG
ncbi:Nuclear transport factor 2 [Thecaphora frezii]